MSNETKHEGFTPGPWLLLHKDGFVHVLEKTGVNTARYKTICSGASEADARLIADSPRLAQREVDLMAEKSCWQEQSKAFTKRLEDECAKADRLIAENAALKASNRELRGINIQGSVSIGEVADLRATNKDLLAEISKLKEANSAYWEAYNALIPINRDLLVALEGMLDQDWQVLAQRDIEVMKRVDAATAALTSAKAVQS